MLDHSDEYLIWDYVEPITVIQVRPQSSNVSTEVAKAHKHDVDRAEMEPSRGVYISDQVLWLVPYVLHNDRIKPRDRIEDQDGKVYVVQKVTEPALNDCWDCLCLDLQIWSELSDEVDLYIANVTLDSSGSRVITYDAPVSIAARIQPDESSKETISGRRKMFSRATMFVLEDVPLAINDRVVDVDGNKWQIVDFADTERIDALQAVTLELL